MFHVLFHVLCGVAAIIATANGDPNKIPNTKIVAVWFY
jgi:hypothetical protein